MRIIAFQLAALSLVLCGQNSYYLYNYNEVELVSPFPGDQFLPLFKRYGDAHMDKNTIYLCDGKANQQGALWSKRTMTEKSWQITFAYRIKGDAIGGNGLAFWYSKEGHRTGAVYGGPDKFDGLGLFFDTFDEETKSETVPMVVGLIGDGVTPFKQASLSIEGNKKIIGSCFKNVRNTDAPVYVKITYFQQHLKVEIDNTSEGKGYSTCFENFEVSLPVGYYFGITASTNIFPDKYEVYALKAAVFSNVSRHADGMAIDKMAENEIFREQSTLVQLIEAVKYMTTKQNEMIGNFRSVLGPVAQDQLPLNSRMETLERDIRHLDNHLDRTEETLHAMMILLKKLIKDTDVKGSTNDSAKKAGFKDNFEANKLGYLMLIGVQFVVTAILYFSLRKGGKGSGAPRKAL